MAVVRSSRVWMAGIAVACTLAGVLAGAVPVRGQNESSGAKVSAESIHRKMQRWEFSQEVRMQEVSGPRPSVDLRSVRLTQEVYSGRGSAAYDGNVGGSREAGRRGGSWSRGCGI